MFKDEETTYWTGTPDDDLNSWLISQGNGSVSWILNQAKYYVRCVRSGNEEETAAYEAEKAQCLAEEEKMKESLLAEVKQPGLNVYWLRCPVGQRWDGKVCTGRATVFSDWERAMKYAVCPTGYEIPDRGDFMKVLQGCDNYFEEMQKNVMRRNIGGFCKKCSHSEDCKSMFASDYGKYWTSERVGGESSMSLFELKWYVDFSTGFIGGEKSGQFGIRCLRKE
jgi:uncharacterized protein (TIGR02145 family)